MLRAAGSSAWCAIWLFTLFFCLPDTNLHIEGHSIRSTHDNVRGRSSDRRKDSIVKTKYGTLRGSKKADESGRAYDEFLGVPFAAPPIGKRRWKKAESPVPWANIRDATTSGPACPQILGPFFHLFNVSWETNEDCLFVDIYVPHGVEIARARKFPVMLFAFPGAYMYGAGDMFTGYNLALNGDVVVITFNYRLGVTGFLATGQANARGNYALWDVHQALAWIKETISVFGGDANKVTLFGCSAGSISTSHSLYSPVSKGFFHRAIEHSGSAIGATSSLSTGYKEFADQLGDYFLCNWGDPVEMIECLRDEDADDLTVWAYVIAGVEGNVPELRPILDGEYIVKKPQDAIKAGASNDFDLMLGRTEHDAAGFVLVNFYGMPFNGSNSIANNKEDLIFFIRSMLASFVKDVDTAYATLKKEYPGIESNDAIRRAHEATDVFTDMMFATAVHSEATLRAKYVPSKKTYMFSYKYRQSFLGYMDWVKGSHMDDLYSVFGPPLWRYFRKHFLKHEHFTESDKNAQYNVQTYWTNFAHNGDPNKGKPVPVAWPTYSESQKQYLQISDIIKGTKKESEKQLRRYKLWNDLMPALDEKVGSPGIKRSSHSMSREKMFQLGNIDFMAEKYLKYQKELFYKNPKGFKAIKEKVDKVVIRLKYKRRKGVRDLLKSGKLYAGPHYKR